MPKVATIRAVDLNSLLVFEKVAALASFSAAARALGLPRSNVSRIIARMEEELGTRLFQRTTREVGLTSTGLALRERCTEIVATVREALDHVGSLAATPRGSLKISAGVGFGINVLAEQLPEFLRRYPEVSISLLLESRAADLVAESVDVAIRLGPLPDSSLVSIRLGEMRRYVCAAPAYLERRGVPRTVNDLKTHDLIEMPNGEGRSRPWIFTKGSDVVSLEAKPRLCVNEALTLFRLVVNGAGIGVLSGYLCAPEIAAGRLVRLVPEWKLPPVEVNIVFPSRRELAPAIRAFADFMREVSVPGQLWQRDPLER
jgi:DNA-binding transcriptional LysR family regulator